MTVFTLLVCGVVLLGCRQYNKMPPGAVVFDHTAVLLVPGADWEQLTNGPLTEVQSLCRPVLRGIGTNDGSLIQVFAAEGNKDPKTAADILEKNVKVSHSIINDTFKQEEFRSAGGVGGVHISYDYNGKSSVHMDKLKAHVYLFQNEKKNCIAINYITFADKDSARVDQMIKGTLKLN